MAEANEASQAAKPTTLKSKLGAVKLAISGIARNDMIGELAVLAMKYLLWHEIPSEAYEKDSGFKRDMGYSAKHFARIESIGLKVLGKYFSDVEIADLGEYIKPNTADGIIANLDKISDADFARIVEARKAKKPAEKPAAEAKSANMAQAA